MKSKIALALIFILGGILSAKILKFSTAYELSLQNDHSIKASEYKYKSMQSQIKSDKSFMFPHLNFSASIGYSRRRYKNKPTIFTKEDSYTRKGTTKSLRISLSQTIYDRQRYKIYESTIIKANRAKIANRLERQKLSIKILETYMNILKSYTKIELFNSYIKYHNSLLRFNEKSYKMGLIGKSDILKERVKHDSIKIGLQNEKRTLKVYKKQLSSYIGDNNYQFPRIKIWKLNNKTINQMRHFVKNKNNIYSNLEYQIASISIEYLKKQVEVAKSGHYPKVMLNASYTKYYSSQNDGVLKDDKEVSLDLSMPIIDGGYTSARIESAKYELLASREDLINTKKELDVSYQRYLANFNTSLDKVKMNKKSYYAAKSYVNTTTKGYKKGLNSIIELFDAKNQMISTKVNYIESVYNLLDSYINMLILTNRLDKLNIIDRVLR